MKRLVAAGAMLLAFSAPLASAAGTPQPAALAKVQRCAALAAQFDKAEVTHKNALNLRDAQALRTEGASLCMAHKTRAGVKYIESALKMIESKPAPKG